MATSWVHPLLVRQGRSEELTERVTKLVEGLDADRERAIRELGEHAGPGLVKCMKRTDVDAKRRQQVASLTADLAGPAQIDDLIGLLKDAGDVGPTLVRGLERLTGESGHGCSSDRWREHLDKKAAEKAVTK